MTMNRTLIRRIGLSLLALFVISILCFLASGCQHAKPAGTITAPVTTAITKAETHTEKARADAKEVKEASGRITRHLSRADGKADVVIQYLKERSRK